MTQISKTASEWRDSLTSEQYHITRESGTEKAFSGPHLNEKRNGEFACVCCGRALFENSARFNSGTGWPSFFAPKSSECVSEHEDRKLFVRRVEVRCADCEAHLGHVFKDGPQPTGLRYCMNGHALVFTPEKEQ